MAEPTRIPSRYRSHRRTQHDDNPEEAPQVPPIPQDETGDDGVVRSRSRYHRKSGAPHVLRPATSYDQDQINVPGLARVGSSSPSPREYASSPSRQENLWQSNSPAVGASNTQPRTPPVQAGEGLHRMRTHDKTDLDKYGYQDLARAYSGASGHASSTPRKPHARSPGLTHQLSSELFPPPLSEPRKQGPKRDGPPSSGQINATRSTVNLSKQRNDDDEEEGGCFGLFKRKRGQTTPQKTEKMPMARAPKSREPPTIRPGGGGIVPGIDAPVSAVNAGERQVLVEWRAATMSLPVTPTTTAFDLIKSASTCSSQPINVKSAVLLESFGAVGVQRPLRRYETIRDILNSWNTDRQNSLVIVDPGTGSSEPELSMSGVPSVRPGDESWTLHHSTKIDQWDKRLVTLRGYDGQMLLQKDPDKPHENIQVSNLTDFDIYTPTPDRLRKKIKPPKKHCYALKSQEKTSMFETTTNYVHFFCTSDKATADNFYAAVQQWRSWYLVHELGKGSKTKPPANIVEAVVAEKPREVPPQYRGSTNSHYLLGSFKPVDMGQFDDGSRQTLGRRMSSGGRPVSSGGRPTSSGGFAKAANQFDTNIAPERRMSTKARAKPPPALDRHVLADNEPLANLARRTSNAGKRPPTDQRSPQAGGFTDGGVVGANYSPRNHEFSDSETRRDDLDDRSRARQSIDGLPRREKSTRVTPAHKNPTSDELQRNKSKNNRPKRETVDLHRSGSRAKDQPFSKPLVDLTPQYKDPPQHTRRGRGHRPDAIGEGGLIESATSPEDVLGVPSSIDWRGHRSIASPDDENSRNPSRQRSLSQGRTATGKGVEEHEPFDIHGLLASSKTGWGGEQRGRGVVNGSRATGPMLDLNEPSVFAQGSLLNKVEREQPVGPTVDRQRRNERDD